MYEHGCLECYSRHILYKSKQFGHCEGDRGGHPTFFGIWSTGLGADVGKNTVQEVVSLIKIDMYLFTYKGGSLQ